MVLDINMDVGEGLDNERYLFPYISSCNIACGGHAGDTVSMKRIVELAKTYEVKIGAHPSYPDREHFGRLVMHMPLSTLSASIESQLVVFKEVAAQCQADIHHVKAHGALYNLAAKDSVIADMLLEVIKSCLNVPIYAPSNSVIAERAEYHNIEVFYEVFADRNYMEDYSLVPRTVPHALILDSDAMFRHVLEIIERSQVSTLSGKSLPVKADTICLHSDSKNAEYLVKTLHEKLLKYGIEIT